MSCSPWGGKESDTTEQLTELIVLEGRTNVAFMKIQFHLPAMNYGLQLSTHTISFFKVKRNTNL